MDIKDDECERKLYEGENLDDQTEILYFKAVVKPGLSPRGLSCASSTSKI
jgi:hypothetical protein